MMHLILVNVVEEEEEEEEEEERIMRMASRVKAKGLSFLPRLP